MNADDPTGRIDIARLMYERAIFTGDTGALDTADRELDFVEADLAVARGRIIHGRFLTQRDHDPEQAREDPRELPLFERAAQLYSEFGDIRGHGEALFWVGCFHQVVRRDDVVAVPVLQRSLELATEAGDKPTMAEDLRHLGIAEHRAGHLDAARQRLEESTQLREETGNRLGVAFNLVGLAYIAIGQGRSEDARALLDEAGAIAQASGARTVEDQVSEARASL